MKKGFTALMSFVLLTAAAMPCGAQEVPEVQRSFHATGGGTLSVSVGAGDITVRVWEKQGVRMTARGLGGDASSLLTREDGNTVTVQYKPPSGWRASPRELQFEFAVPGRFNLDLSSGQGDIGLRDGLTGDVKLSTSGGELRIESMHGRAEGKTLGGGILIHRISGTATLHTGGGNIQVDHADGDLAISTEGGEIVTGNIGRNLNAETSGGNIQIGRVGGDLRAATSSGNITVGPVGGNVDLSTLGGDIGLASGRGRIRAKTSGGDVTIAAAVGSVDVSSSGGTVKVSLTPKGDSLSVIQCRGGDVSLFIPPESRATIRAEVSGRPEDEIRAEFSAASVTINKETGEGRAEYILHGGGQSITVRTSLGSVFIKKPGPAGVESEALAREGSPSSEFLKSFPLSRSGSLTLHNPHGDVQVKSWEKDEVLVHAIKHADNAGELARLQVVVTSSGDSVAIETLQPPESLPHWKGGPRVQYVITVPRHAILRRIAVEDGKIEIARIAGPVNASTANGAIEASGLSNSCKLETVNGRIRAVFTSLPEGAEVRLKSENGSLDIRLPSRANATVTASTATGHISDEFGSVVPRGATSRAAVSKAKVSEGRIGAGGSAVHLETVNGSISIQKSGDRR